MDSLRKASNRHSELLQKIANLKAKLVWEAATAGIAKLLLQEATPKQETKKWYYDPFV